MEAKLKPVNEMLDYLKSVYLDQHEQSRVARFYQGKSLFITGASGFIGKTLLEKLLRSCPQIDTIYILMRPKRGKEIGQRVKELTASEIFNRVKSMDGGEERLTKIVPIRGDITEPRLGVSDEDLALMADKVSLVFHSAATVKFQEPMRQAIAHNVISVKNLLDLAEKFTKLTALVHVSTAYSNCNRKEVREVFYEPPIRPAKLVEMADWMDSDTLERISPALIEGRPNTYTYTKAVAESLLVDQLAKRFPNLPVAVVRPSIVAGIWREPIPGWVDNYNGPTGVVLSMVTGLLQAMRADPTYCADIVPVDIVSNLLICTAWYIVTLGGDNKPLRAHGVPSVPIARGESEKPEAGREIATAAGEITIKHEPEDKSSGSNRIEVFNCVSGSRNPVNWKMFARYTLGTAAAYPCSNLARYPGSHLISNYYLYTLYDFINHKCVAYIMDLFLAMLGKKPKMVPIYHKMDRMVTTLTPFTTNQWAFDCSNVVELYRQLEPIDKDLFNFDIKQLNWDTYLRNNYFGAKLYVMKDDPYQLPKAIAAHSRLKWRSSATTIIFMMALYYFIFSGSSLESTFIDSIKQLIDYVI